MTSDRDFWLCENQEGKFSEKYILGDIIGRGSYSTVYNCLCRGRSEWACKIIQKGKVQKQKVQKDIPILLSLNHKSLVKLKEVFETENEIQMIQEVMRGGELFERIVERGCYSEQVASIALRDVLKALQYLHSLGIVHGDIKPENLLYATDSVHSVIKVADYGLNRFSPKNYQNIACGIFCAPELFKQSICGSEIDMWSLGVVCYVMLCGCDPFWDSRGESIILQNISEGAFKFNSPHWDTISPSAKELIDMLLSVNPLDRPTAEEALEHPWVQGLTTPDTHMAHTVFFLKKFNARRKFKAATTVVIAAQRALSSLTRSSSLECF